MSSIAAEQYLLLLLSDSNLPTGGFIASSGLESHLQHGQLESHSKASGLLEFLRASLHSYAALQLPFLRAIHRLATLDSLDTLVRIQALDAQLEAMTLNHVARRASVAQGVALLTLYQRSFALPAADGGDQVANLVDELRKAIRNGQCSGQQTTGFAVLAAGLGVSLQSAMHLFLFLQARSLLSSAVRLNVIGPYVSHRLLLHDVRSIVDATIEQYDQSGDAAGDSDDEGGPATTWPLGEIVATRHQLLHSKIFNS